MLYFADLLIKCCIDCKMWPKRYCYYYSVEYCVFIL